MGRIRDTAEWTERGLIWTVRRLISSWTLGHRQTSCLLRCTEFSRQNCSPPACKIFIGIGGRQIIPRGTTQVSCLVSRNKASSRKSLTFYVIDDNVAILGRAVCEYLNLFRRVDTVVAVDIQPGHTRQQQLIEQN